VVIYNTAFLLSSFRLSPVELVETAPVDVRRSPPAGWECRWGWWSRWGRWHIQRNRYNIVLDCRRGTAWRAMLVRSWLRAMFYEVWELERF